jgi:cytochrome d ubiquinol oxidase subunit I
MVELARAQFALTIMFHYLFPPLSIGLGAMMVMMEGLYLRTKDPAWSKLVRFWSRVFAVNFAVGVASGIVMEMQFGTNWATYSRFVGDVFGSALAAEGIFAFFLESGFLAVLVFGWDRVGPRMHFFATCMVFLGSVFSSVWIVIANSWQQTPAGHHIVGEGVHRRAEIVDFWAMVFNPSAMPRLAHVLLGAFLVGAFFVASVSAYHVLRGIELEASKRAFTLALGFAFASVMAMGLSGHEQANTVAEYQPVKLAAFEGHFRTSPEGVPLYLFGVPDVEAGKVKYGVGIPGMLSMLVKGDPHAPLPALDTVPPEDRPPVGIPFTAYHVMITLAGAMTGLATLGLFFRIRGTLFEKKWLLRAFVGAVIMPYIANQAGWVACEVGRQPWVVYGLLRTKDAASKVVHTEQVAASIAIFSVLYLALFAVWLVVLTDKILHGPGHVPGSDHDSDDKGSGLLAAASALADPGSPDSLSAPAERGPEPRAAEVES